MSKDYSKKDRLAEYKGKEKSDSAADKDFARFVKPESIPDFKVIDALDPLEDFGGKGLRARMTFDHPNPDVAAEELLKLGQRELQIINEIRPIINVTRPPTYKMAVLSMIRQK